MKKKSKLLSIIMLMTIFCFSQENTITTINNIKPLDIILSNSDTLVVINPKMLIFINSQIIENETNKEHIDSLNVIINEQTEIIDSYSSIVKSYDNEIRLYNEKVKIYDNDIKLYRRLYRKYKILSICSFILFSSILIIK